MVIYTAMGWGGEVRGDLTHVNVSVSSCRVNSVNTPSLFISSSLLKVKTIDLNLSICLGSVIENKVLLGLTVRQTNNTASFKGQRFEQIVYK